VNIYREIYGTLVLMMTLSPLNQVIPLYLIYQDRLGL